MNACIGNDGRGIPCPLNELGQARIACCLRALCRCSFKSHAVESYSLCDYHPRILATMGKAITSLRCHALVLLALVLDLGVAALVALTYKKDILLPFAKNTIERNLQNYLPTFGTILGAGVAYANKSAISALVTIQARRRMASRGLTFKQISYYDVLCEFAWLC